MIDDRPSSHSGCCVDQRGVEQAGHVRRHEHAARWGPAGRQRAPGRLVRQGRSGGASPSPGRARMESAPGECGTLSAGTGWSVHSGCGTPRSRAVLPHASERAGARGARHAGPDDGLPADRSTTSSAGPSATTGTRPSSRSPRRARRPPPTASGPSGPAAWAACSTAWVSQPDARVGTFAWNTARHLELYFAVPCTRPGAAHAEHPALPRAAHLHRQPRRRRGDLRRPLAVAAAGARCSTTFTTVRHLVVMDDGGDADVQLGTRPVPRCTTTRTLLAEADPVAWPTVDENRAASMCYTSGTTGNPKGAAVQPPLDVPAHLRGHAGRLARGRASRDVLLPVVPMFHANAWGLAHAAVASGAAAGHARPRPVAARPWPT